MSRRTNKSRLLLVIIPVAAVAVGLSVAFALPLAASTPPQQVQTKEHDCASLAGAIKYYVIDIDGTGTNETRRLAASTLMDRYCNTPGLVNDIGAMESPSIGLISYGCDVVAGEIENDALKSSLEQYESIYCEGATLAILEKAEYTGLAIHDFKEELASLAETQKERFRHESENSDTGPDPNMVVIDTDGAEARLGEITVLVENAKTLAFDGHYYQAAKSLETANAELIELASEVYS